MIFDSVENDYFMVEVYQINFNGSFTHLGFYRGSIEDITAQIEIKYKQKVYIERSKYHGWY
jgi:hypothetical protein